MKRILIYAVTAVCLASTALIAGVKAGRADSSDALLAVDGPYRDGLYVGRFMRAQGSAMQAPIGRWSSDEDRSAFLAGYERGYGEPNSKSTKSF